MSQGSLPPLCVSRLPRSATRGPDPWRAWRRLLPGLPRLSHLNLGDNKIFFSGAEMLAQVLDTCPSLVYLNLQCNMIDDVGVGHLVRPPPLYA